MDESDELKHVLLEQQTHELVCPDCEAYITHEVIVRKRKRDLNESSPLQQYSNGVDEENEPNVMLPHMLFEQESHDLICPVCEHAVTGEVILQKRKREVEPIQSGGRRHGIQALNTNEENPLWMRVERDGLEDAAEEDDLGLRSEIQEQESYDLLCPDCESCITHEVILQKRKRPITSKDIPRGKQDRNPPLHRHHSQTRRGDEVDKLKDSDEEDPPLKRHRRTEQALPKGADPEEKEIRRVLRDQRIYDLTCPDCASRITYQVIVKKKTDESGKPVGLLEKRGARPRRRVASYIDDNPWKTRYKLVHGHSKPFAVSKEIEKAKEDERAANYGAIKKSSLPEDIQPRVANSGAITTSSLRDDPPKLVSKYETNGNSSLREPLLPLQREATGEGPKPPITIKDRYTALKGQSEDFMGPAITYFLILLFLYCVWWILRIIPPD